MKYRVRIIVDDEWEARDIGDLASAQNEAEDLAQQLRDDHMVNATVESVVVVHSP